MASSPQFRIDTSGLNDLIRDLRKLNKEFGKAFTVELRTIGNDVRDKARVSPRAPYRTGRLRGSIKTSVRRSQISLYSILPYAGVQHWGGTIAPRGTPIHIEGKPWLAEEALAEGPKVEVELVALLDRVAARYAGFH